MHALPARLRPLAVAAVLVAALAACSEAQPVTFTSGLAAGDVRPDGAVLWTRASREATLTLDVAMEFDGEARKFRVAVRIDAPQEWHYYRHGGILQYVLRQLATA